MPKQHVSARLTQYLARGTFSAALAVSLAGAIASETRDAVLQTHLRPCAKFQPNPFSSFGADASEQTDRQTDRLAEDYPDTTVPLRDNKQQ